MATIKSYTDLEQSKKLAEILPIESADMWYQHTGISIKDGSEKPIYFPMVIRDCESDEDIPCWSLAALLGVLPNNEHITTTLSRGGWKIEPVEYIDKWFCEYEDEVGENNPCKGFTVSADNPVDACVAMIEKLHELNLL